MDKIDIALMETHFKQFKETLEKFVAGLKTKSEERNGLYGKYIVSKANGEPVEKDAFYFVLRLDSDDEWGSLSRNMIAKSLTDIKKIDPRLADDLLLVIQMKNPMSVNGIFIDVKTLDIKHLRWLSEVFYKNRDFLFYAKKNPRFNFLGFKDVVIENDSQAAFQRMNYELIFDPDYFCELISKKVGIPFNEYTPIKFWYDKNISNIDAVVALPPFGKLVKWVVQTPNSTDTFEGKLIAYSQVNEKIEITVGNKFFTFKLNKHLQNPIFWSSI